MGESGQRANRALMAAPAVGIDYFDSVRGDCFAT
jgi:hypothetical protein